MVGEIVLLFSSFCFVVFLLLKQVTNNNSSGTQQGPVGGSDAQINCSDRGGLTELEKLLKQKTFTRHVLFVLEIVYVPHVYIRFAHVCLFCFKTHNYPNHNMVLVV